MQYRTTKNHVLRLALPCFVALLALTGIGLVSSVAMASAREPKPPRLYPYFHGNGNGLFELILRWDGGGNEGSHEAKDIVIHEFSASAVRLDLILPFVRDNVSAKTKRTGTVKPYVVRTIKVKVRKP